MDCRTQLSTIVGLLARLDSSSDGHHASCGTERIMHMKFRVHRRRSVADGRQQKVLRDGNNIKIKDGLNN